MKRPSLLLFVTVLLLSCSGQEKQPRYVDPGVAGRAPADAIVLFDGTNTNEWVHRNGQPAKWPIKDGALTCSTGTGDIMTKHRFASAQIHVEFAIPNMPFAKDQARGNSGVYIQKRYEIQVLDSYQNPTYANGSCGAVYGQHAPLVNASRPPEQWQTYDMIYHAPKCQNGKMIGPATLTMLQNGVLVQDHVEISKPTGGGEKDNPCDPGPLLLQDHYHPDVKATFMRFRNIWYRPLEDK